MGAIISVFEKGFAGLAKGFADGIGKAFKAGLTDPAKRIGDGIKGMTDGAGAEFEAYRKDLKPWFNVPDKAAAELGQYRKGLSKWFDMPDRLTPNVNSLTTIVVHLSEPTYALIIILCALASIVILRYLFKSCQDCLNAWFALDWNEQNMHKMKPRKNKTKAPMKRGLCSRIFCCCCRGKKEKNEEDVERMSMKSDEFSEIDISSGASKVDEMVEKNHRKQAAIMGGMISMLLKPLTDMVDKFVGGIGDALGSGLKAPFGLLRDGLGSITGEGWNELSRMINQSTAWFQLPENAMKEFKNARHDMKPWFKLPHNITANMNTVTSIMEYLSSPVYVLIIITCVFLCVLIIRGLFKSIQDCLDTWFYFERNEKHLQLQRGPDEEEWNQRYSCWRRFLTCFYRRRIYVTDLTEAPHVPDMVKRYEEKNIQTIHNHI